MEKVKNQKNKTNPSDLKKQRDVVNFFCDIQGTIDGLFHADKEERQKFFDKLKKFSDEVDLNMVLVTMYGDERIQEFKRLFMIFEQFGMKDVLHGVQGDGIFVNSNSEKICDKCFSSKVGMVLNYEEKHDKDTDGVKYVIYAGDSEIDKAMIDYHVRGTYYRKSNGCYYINSNRGSDLKFNDGNINEANQENLESMNYTAIINSLDCVLEHYQSLVNKESQKQTDPKSVL